MTDTPRANAIAIIGMAGRFPGARSLDEFWHNISEGVETLETWSDADLDTAGVDRATRDNPRFVRKGTVIADADCFDAAFFGYAPREAQIIDPQQRVFLECAWSALEHAGYGRRAIDESVGVYGGTSSSSYLTNQLLPDAALVESVGRFQLLLGNDKDFLCTRVSYKLNLQGPSFTIQTACSTSLVAVQVACRALRRGECDLALAGGVSVVFPERTGYLYEDGMIFSPDGHCRPFDAEARGTHGGAGAGIVVLKRLTDALADRDTIHAVILGAAINNDGSSKAGFTAPGVDGQVEAIATAHALADVEARSITYVEAHGTGTPLGDPIEIAALTRVFRDSTDRVGFCRIGSLKANIGHLDSAAGIVSVIKTVLALEHRELPPLVHFHSPNPALNLAESPFVASNTRAPWIVSDGPRRAGVSSFGIGGTNAHVVLEEAPAPAPTVAGRDVHLVVISTRTKVALAQATANLVEHFSQPDDVSVANSAYTLQVGREPFSERRAVVVRDNAQAVERLAQPDRAPVVTGTHEGGPRPVAFLFTGQGSQHAQMGSGLYRTERAYREAFDRCAALLEPALRVDIRRLIPGDAALEARMQETWLAQPLLFATEYALAALWRHWGVTPSAMLGHSIGEYVAAHLAGVFTLEDALQVVAERGRLMQSLPPGGMLAVHVSEADVGQWLGNGVELAAVNAPAMCTVSGPNDAITQLIEALKSARVDHRALHTSHAFHSGMMDPILAPFAEVVSRVRLTRPEIPYVSNVTGTWITAEQATSPAYYANHLRQAVRYEAGVRALTDQRDDVLVEVGPGNTLTTLARMTLGADGARRVVSTLAHPQDQRTDVEALLEATGRLWTSGVTIDWNAMHEDERLHRVPLPTYPFERVRHRTKGRPAESRPAAGARGRANNVDDWFFAPTWTRDVVRTISGALHDTWLVLAPSGPLGDAMCRRVSASGGSPVRIELGDGYAMVGESQFRVDPRSTSDFTAVLKQLASGGRTIRGGIHLWSTIDGAPGSENLESAKSLAFHSLVALAAAVFAERYAHDVQIIVGTCGAQSVLDEPVMRPESALTIGPVMVLPVEVPGLHMRVVDLEPVDSPAGIEAAVGALVEEAATVDGESSVARRRGRRWLRRAEPLALPANPTVLPLKAKGVYVIVGGLGGIGLALASWLSQKVQARLLLISRTGLPDRGEWEQWVSAHAANDATTARISAVRSIEANGGEVMHAAADVSDEASMREAIDRARTRWGDIDGVVHAAGVPGGGLGVRKSAHDADAVLSSKVEGLEVLARVLRESPLEFVVLCSSVSALVGGPDMCDYASANAYLDAFAESSACPPNWRNVIALDWWGWSEVGMAVQLDGPGIGNPEQSMRWHQGISTADGLAAFERALASGLRRIVIIPYDLREPPFLAPRRLARSLDEAGDPRGASPTASDAEARPQLAVPFQMPTTETEVRIGRIWSELLGIRDIGVDDDFFELGGHSLLATRVLARIEDALGARLGLRDVFNAPTIRRLAERVTAEADGNAVPVEDPDDDREDMAF